jgi:hypothetical protein
MQEAVSSAVDVFSETKKPGAMPCLLGRTLLIPIAKTGICDADAAAPDIMSDRDVYTIYSIDNVRRITSMLEEGKAGLDERSRAYTDELIQCIQDKKTRYSKQNVRRSIRERSRISEVPSRDTTLAVPDR